MIKFLIFIPLVLLITIVCLGIYLQPNNLKNCNNTVSEIKDCQKADLIVAISGGDTTARTQAAIDLYKNGWADKILFSGAAQDKTGPSNALAMKNQALKAGIAEDKILLDETAETTKQNASNSQNIVSSNNFDDIILVTSGYHQRRAYMEFSRRTEGINIRNYPVSTDKDWSFWWWLTVRGWSLAISEIVKIAALPAEVSK